MMTRPAALTAAALVAGWAATTWPLHPAAWPLLTLAVICGAAAAVTLAAPADPD